MLLKNFLVGVTIACALISCGDPVAPANTDSTGSDSASVRVVSIWKELTESWSASLNLRNASIMKSFYGDSVLYYGDHLTSDEVVHRQQEYFGMNPDYQQKITEYIDEIQQPDGTWLIKITKHVTAGGKTADYPASLVYGSVNGIWKIIAESDDITDLNKAKNLQASYEPETSTIEGLVEENFTYGSNPGGDPKSDSKIKYYVLWSKYSLDVVATEEQAKAGSTTEKNVERIQLVGNEEQIRNLLNHKVRISGKLFHSNSNQHYTSVLMNVELIEEVL
jgi:hypothetical protein